MRNLVVFAALALFAAHSFAETHTVTFRRMNGTVLQKIEVAHGGSVTAPAGPAEADHTFKGWDHGDWLGCVTNDINVWALYEGTKTWAKGTNYGSESIVFREQPYSLDEYFKMYDNLAWADEFSRSGTNDVNRDYWNYDTENRHELNYETAGDNQKEYGGNLAINVRREHAVRQSWWGSSGEEYDFTGGGIKSNGKVAFKYGRCEIRAKLTRQKGCWPAFWMMGNSGNWPECGELDILEQPSGGDWIAGTLHIDQTSGGGSLGCCSVVTPQDGVHFGDGFHRFGTIMNEREVIWYVDDHIFKRMDVRDSRYHMYRDRPWFIVFGMGIQSNVWVQVPDAPATKYDVPELDERGVDFLVDYCRIYTNTNEGNMVAYQPPAASAKLSAPVKATVWLGWDLGWGTNGAAEFMNNVNKGYDAVDYVKGVLTGHLVGGKTDVLTFLTEPMVETGKNRGEFDIPGYTMMSISFNSKGDNHLMGNALFNRDRFSASESGVDFMTLSSDMAFTNCYAMCVDLKEKATGARFKVVSVNVVSTNGIENASGTVAQGFNTLFSKLNAMKNDKVIVFFQGMAMTYNNPALYNYISARAASSLQAPYTLAGTYTSPWARQCAYVTQSVSASAAQPAKIPVTRSNLAVSYSLSPKALQATVTFDELPDDGLTDAFNASDYAKSMNVTFSGYSGSTLANFPVLVKLSTAISGFSYSDFQLPNGGDLRFTDSSGTVLPHEIDTWNPNGESTVWVKVPSLKKDAKIVAHFGCARPVRVDPSQVWDSNYVGVWHLGESALPLKESSGNAFDFTYQTGTGVGYAASGAVGGAVNFPSGGLTNTLVSLDHDNLDGFTKFTIEAWTKQAAHKSTGGILSKRETYNREASYYFYDKDGKTMLRATTNGTSGVDCIYTIQPPVNQWNHQVYSFDTTTSSSNLKGYLNGAAAGSASKAFRKIFAGRGNLFLGNLNPDAADQSFNGQIDEVRISRCVRSAEWIKATHDTVMNDSFATYAVQGVTPPVPQPVFAHEIDVTFSGYSGGSALADFPVLIRLSPNIAGFSYADFQIANGGDLRFYDAAGNMLAHEIDTWNESGESTAWVKVPTLDASTSITAKYGCAEPPEAADPKSVWSNGYVGVWHLSARDGEMSQPDSAAAGRAFELDADYADGVSAGVDGAAGLAAAFHRRSDGKGAYRLDDAAKAFSGFTKFTLEYWTYQDDHEPGGAATEGYVMRKASAFDAYESSNNGRMALRMFISGGSSGGNYVNAEDVAGNKPPRAAWNHSVQVFDGTEDGVDGVDTKINRAVYLNGVRRGLSASSSLMGTMISNGNSLCLGNEAPGGTKSYRGAIDEVRISNTTRSEAWVKATHDTIANASFATYTLRGAPSSGYAAWIAGKGITGAAAAFERKTNGIANGIRYAFDIDPATSEIGTPIIKVVRDADGNPSVQSRDLATGRDDVTFGILATPDLTDWSNATLVPMKKFATDGLWRPTASESSGYVFPSQMFFKYKIDIQQ